MPRSICEVIAIVMLAGCATPAVQREIPKQFVIAGVTPSEKLLGQVYVESVTEANDIHLPWTAQVDSMAFKQILEQHLAAIGYKSDSSNARFKIDAEVHRLAKPGFGINFTVDSTFRYTIVEAGNAHNLPIKARGTARKSDALYPDEGVKIARERSMDQNAIAFIKQLTAQYGK